MSFCPCPVSPLGGKERPAEGRVFPGLSPLGSSEQPRPPEHPNPRPGALVEAFVAGVSL